MRSFEVQTYKDGKWKMNLVFDDRKVCIEEAKKIEQGGRYSGIRVVEEDYDEETNQATSRVLYRGGAAKGEKSPRSGPSPKSRQAGPQGGGERERKPGGGRVSDRQKSNLLVPVLVLLVIIMGGLLALFGLQNLSVFR